MTLADPIPERLGGLWIQRGAGHQSMLLATGNAMTDPQAATSEIDTMGYGAWHYWSEHPTEANLTELLRVAKGGANALSADGEHPMHRLMMRGDLGSARLWEKAIGLPEPESMRNGHGDTFLSCAVWSGDMETFRWALERWTGLIDMPDCSGMTPFSLSIYRLGLQGVTSLMKAGADPDLADQLGNTALHHAALSGDFEIYTVLHDSGCAHATNANGKTPEDIMAVSDRFFGAPGSDSCAPWKARYALRLRF